MKIMPSTLVHWAVYLASLTALTLIVVRMHTVIILIVTTVTFMLWAWLARGNRKNTDHQTYTSDPLDSREIHTARSAVGMRIQKNINQHVMPAIDSLHQMTDIVSDGSRRLQISFADLNRKSGQQLSILSGILTRCKEEGAGKSGRVTMEEFIREVNTALDNTSRIAKDINQDVSNAVTAMQFEDSASQIALYIQAQLKALHTSMEIIRQELLDDTDIIECLDRIDRQLQNQQAAELRQVVTSVDMRTGEIELF